MPKGGSPTFENTLADLTRSDFDRVNLVGSSGSGKSTLGRALAQALGQPVVEIDDLFWGPSWTPTPDEVFLPRLRGARRIPMGSRRKLRPHPGTKMGPVHPRGLDRSSVPSGALAGLSPHLKAKLGGRAALAPRQSRVAAPGLSVEGLDFAMVLPKSWADSTALRSGSGRSREARPRATLASPSLSGRGAGPARPSPSA